MRDVLYQIQDDLLRLRSMVPMNCSKSKAVLKRIDWAITAIQKREHAMDVQGEE